MLSASIDRSGSGEVKQVWLETATTRYLLWAWMSHIDGPMDPEASKLFDLLYEHQPADSAYTG